VVVPLASSPRGIDYWDRIWRWLLWVIAFSSIPYLATLILSQSDLPFLEKLTGSGQLLLTSVAIFGSALRDTTGWTHMPRVKEATIGLGMLFLVTVALIYARIVSTTGPLGAPADLGQLHANANLSVGLFLFTLVTAFGLTVAGTPAKVTVGATSEKEVDK